MGKTISGEMLTENGNGEWLKTTFVCYSKVFFEKM